YTAPSWRPKDSPGYAPPAGANSASFRSRGLQRPSASMALPTKRPPTESSVGRGRPLFLRLGREQQRIALGAAGVGRARRLGLGNVPGEHRDHADAALV